MRQDFFWCTPSAARRRRTLREISAVVVHRIEVSQEDPHFRDTPRDVARFFAEHPVGRRATGGSMPYSLLVCPRGIVTQTVPLLQVTPHARLHNATTLGIGCLGDFRQRSPGRPQWRALFALSAYLLRCCNLGVQALRAHDELHEGSYDPDKECPGIFLSVAALRDEIAASGARRQHFFELVW